MKIAIHHSTDSFSFSNRWIQYFKLKNIKYKIVDCYSNNIIQDIDDCDVLMWHFSNYRVQDTLMARHVLFTAQKMGKRVFPDFETSWHFDDKVAQKYLLESVGAPMVPSFVFYNKLDTINFLKIAKFPIVFKLRRGSGGNAVKLLNTFKEAKKIINKAFGKGVPQMDFVSIFYDRIQKYRDGIEPFVAVLKGFSRIFIKSKFYKTSQPEKGYAYFQEFIPNNLFDIRIIVIGDKAFALKRFVRKNDFRASGSGNIAYAKEEFDERCVSISFDVSSKLKAQCIAYDYVFDANNYPLIVEVSYGFSPDSYDLCKGYWDKNLKWFEGKFNPYGWMIEDILK